MTSSRQETPGTPEWPDTLDVRALLGRGWRPTPFREFILKVHSRCNLSCDYCYMYEMADQSWRRQPRKMAKPTIDQVAMRIAEHARAKLLDRVDVTLHGGEPLLAGVDHLRYTVEAVLTACAPDVRVRFNVQTNGILLDPPVLELFREYGVQVGVSLDGDEEGHDRHRRWANGQGSFSAVRAGVERLRAAPYRHLFNGLLSTVDIQNDPVRAYEAMLEFEPPAINFLLPHGNWDTPPPARPPDDSTPYGDWLVAVFDRWYRSPEKATQVRLFDEIMMLLFGRPSTGEAVGLSPVAIVVVETNGEIEQVDTLKSAYEGATGTALHVSRDPFEAALLLPSIAARQIRGLALAEECQECRLHQVCGAGHYTHRYRSGRGFRNPTVYCHDLQRLITHIHAEVSRDLEALRG
ncbi:FxsB family radical SAM/SPASM domain protein [Actinoallomurus sp. NBC_01490]|uniref:FxsB family cyclophane-forming radical SAM/SPASM peptide maturase n=1 Tax=Actinoallomurus sp. NBC_01490 TaxID=2903557 RepID=UPI002E2F9FD3|nr:FxsB family cyclophane-forming radical SAM/SPASM peptide maturase [Actinoallomurus sp. NBC_01490]